MKYVKQFCIIIIISFAGEVLNHVIPFPIPASIYGIVLMFTCLKLRIIRLEAVKETSSFLIEAMPLMFIPAAVGLTESWQIIKPSLVPYIAVTVVTTVVVMAVSGRTTQAVIRGAKERTKEHE